MSDQVIERKPNGQFAKGVSGNLGGNAQRSRHALNADTIREMHLAFRRGGRKAIDKVMRAATRRVPEAACAASAEGDEGRAYRRRQGDDRRAARSGDRGDYRPCSRRGTPGRMPR